MNHNISIAIDGVILRPLNESDSEKYRMLRNNPDIGKWFTFKGFISQNQQFEWYRKYLENPNEVMFSLFDEQDNFIGANSIYDIKDTDAEYGRLIIDPFFSGYGYGYKATRAAAIIAKERLGLDCLKLEVYSNNASAYKTYKKVGFVDTGIIDDSHGNKMITMQLDLNNINNQGD